MTQRLECRIIKAMRDLPTGTVTFLFTDIEGSTRLLHELGADGYAEALANHRIVLREAFAGHGGVEVDTQGDAFFVAFPDAREALVAARQAQEGLSEGPIRVRMGLHTGEPMLAEEGYVGLDVHVGARIGSAAHGGQIVCSRRTKELAEDAVAFTDLGEHRLKDLAEPVWIYQIGVEFFPPLKTLSNTNLPAPASPFIGRQQELDEAEALLEGSRLFTVLGPGGAGKTRFAIELASRQLDRFPNGVFWVGLAPVRDPALVVETAARTVGAKDGLAEHVGERQMMILLDNLEQVIAAAPDLAALVEDCPNLTMLVTSRQLMRVRGERAYTLPPLAVDEGVALFCERASVDPSHDVVELCRRLDGLPLAIELAAARATVLTPDQLVARLGERLDLLRGGRDADPRQQTLRATIEWSHDLLDETEQRLFARLSVFAGGATLEAAEGIADAELDTIQSLVEKSLVRHTVDRFGMLETIREYALERLQAFPDTEDIHRRHASFMLSLAESANLSIEAKGPQRHQIVAPEHDNLRAAIEWTLDAGQIELGLRIAVALENYWITRNPWEGARWFERLFERAHDVEPSLRARALRDYGGSSDMSGDLARGAALYEESLAAFRALGDEANAGDLLHRLGVMALVRGDLGRARGIFEESLAISRRVGFRWLETQSLGSLGNVERDEGDVAAAADLFERSGALAAEIGNVWWESYMVGNLAEMAFDSGRIEESARLSLRTLELCRGSGDRAMMLYGLAFLARVAAARANWTRAGVLLGAVEGEEARGLVQRDWEEERVKLVGPLAAETEPAFVVGRQEGRRLTLQEAVDRALAED